LAKFCAVKSCVAAVLPLGSTTRICTIPLVSECAAHVTLAVTVVLDPCVTGLGDALADEVNVGGANGVAAIHIVWIPKRTRGLIPNQLRRQRIIIAE
jgi:hypothetical protein